jgi:hypothetical protein
LSATIALDLLRRTWPLLNINKGNKGKEVQQVQVTQSQLLVTTLDVTSLVTQVLVYSQQSPFLQQQLDL